MLYSAPVHPAGRLLAIIASLTLCCKSEPKKPVDAPVASTPVVASSTMPAGTAPPGPVIKTSPGMFRIGPTLLPRCGKEADPYPCRDEPTTIDAFEIDLTEVTTEAYAECARAGACATAGLTSHYACNWAQRETRARHPINCVSHKQAEAYCRWAGKRLPSGDEWLVAARGPKRLRYPWGNQEVVDLFKILNRGCWRKAGTCEVGKQKPSEDLFPLLDMEGNIAEWTVDKPCTRPRELCGVSPSEQGREWRLAFGRSFLDPEIDDPFVLSFTWFQHHLPDKPGKPNLGFRCAR